MFNFHFHFYWFPLNRSSPQSLGRIKIILIIVVYTFMLLNFRFFLGFYIQTRIQYFSVLELQKNPSSRRDQQNMGLMIGQMMDS